MSLINIKNLIIHNPNIEIPSFEVNKGDIIHLKGDSGIGKSSFLKSLARLKKISSGEIFYKEKVGLTAQQIREFLLYIPQFSGSETINVTEYIDEIFSVNTISSDITSDLEEFGMSYIILKRIDQISGGERQILNLLIAMKLSREILILDESFSAIDSHRLSRIIEKIIAWKQDARAIIYISHQVLELDKATTQIYQFKKTQGVVSLSKL